jgi:hypothetical protein
VWRDLLLFLGLLAVAAGTAFAYVFLVEPRLQTATDAESAVPFGGGPPQMSTPMVWPGVRQPIAVSAGEAQIEDEAEVIGVSAGGSSRAYLVRAFNNPATQVVNDLLGDVPISVTFCDRTRHAAVFTGPANGKPLEMSFGGWMQGRMVVVLNQSFYEQKSGASTNANLNPYVLPAHDCVQTTWKAWRAAHPDTDIYLGGATDGIRLPTAGKKG